MDEIIAAIETIIESLKVKDSGLLIEAVLNRLSGMGYSVTGDDAWMIAFDIQKVVNSIMNSCNTLSVPDGLFYVVVDRVCGEFLYGKKQTGTLELENLNLDGAITQIKEGDTTVNFADGLSDEQKFDALIEALKNEGEGELVCYRKIKW